MKKKKRLSSSLLLIGFKNANFLKENHKNNYDDTVKAIRKIKSLTDKPFGTGILLEFDNSNTISMMRKSCSCKFTGVNFLKKKLMKLINMVPRSYTRTRVCRSSRKGDCSWGGLNH
ncbi:hypothetical protein FRX31_031517 [Thalictrum thalictroides]|uniref:Uncharacterized protein n=1 Tax=Thalictrum thalictroides TaxID=46969 RepID=A0A7J6V257_THATH|nr:hypothetical protein FRX31_031517 [Thalictrum thalictroides]